MPLTDVAVRTAKPDIKPRKIFDERGLFLLIHPSGGKSWKLKYQFLGKERKLSLGRYPEISLKQARLKRDDARRLLADGEDPAERKREAKLAKIVAIENSFEAVANELIAKLEAEGKSKTTIKKLRWLLTKLSPSLGARPISEILPQELLAVLRETESKGQYESARRLRSFSSRVFRFAVATGRATTDPAQPLQGALITPQARHHSAITEEAKFGELLVAIASYSGQPLTRIALQFSAHTFQRPGEIRQAEWDEFDLEKAVWTIPASRMKQRKPHQVPLSKQVLELLDQARMVSPNGPYVFPKLGSWRKPMSENAVNQALRRMGYGSDKMTAHGFRSTASTLLNESGEWSYDAIERALAHADPNQVRAAYHRGSHWDERVAMAQWWSDRIEGLARQSAD